MSDATDGNGKSGGHGNLTLYIVAAIVLAVIVALLAPRTAMLFEVGGQVFLRLLQMVVVPLVMASVMSGILGLGDVRKLGRPGGAAIAYYMTTTVVAVITGLIVVNVINPGVNIDKAFVEKSRAEGEKEVQRVAEASGHQLKMVTWDFDTHKSRTVSGESDILRVAAERPPVLRLRIAQKGTPNAGAPANVVIMWRAAEEEFERLKWQDSDDQEVDTYRAIPAGREGERGDPQGREDLAENEGVFKKELQLPDNAYEIKLLYTAQQGGEFSVLTAEVVPGPPTVNDIGKNLVLMLFTDNLLGSMVEINLLPLIVFSIVFAGMLTTMGKRSESIANLVLSINDALLNFILLLMRVAPIGIFCLVAARFGAAQADGKFIELLLVQLKYIITVLTGLLIHMLVTLPLILYLFTRRNPFKFMYQMSQSILTAFSTASSTATLPVTMECAEKKAGVSRRSTEFVLPLGATINMDGTALYEAAAAIFIAQAYHVVDPSFDLTFGRQAVIAITATLAAIGAAGIPEAGLVTLLIVLNAVGLPLPLIGLILPVDWLLDRFRTAVNAFGDAVGAAVVDQTFEKTST